MVTTGTTYDDSTNTMTVGSTDNCLTSPTANAATHVHQAHLVIQNVEDLVGWQVRLNYIGDKMRPNTINFAPFTDSLQAQNISFNNLPIDQSTFVHRDLVTASSIPAAPADGTNTPQTASLGASYNGAQNFAISADTPAKAVPDDSSYSAPNGGVLAGLALQVVGDESGNQLFMDVDDGSPNSPGSGIAFFNGSGSQEVFLPSSSLGDGFHAEGIGCQPTPTPTSPPTPPPPGTPGPDRIQQLNIPANDLVYDRFSQKLYASVPSTAGEDRGNSITPIDPFAGAIGSSVFIGSEPARLAVSDDGKYVYAALNGATSIRRFDIQSQTAGLEFPTGVDRYDGPLFAEDIEVLPGNSSAVAVSLKNPWFSPRREGVAVYDDGVMRGNRVIGGNVIEFSDSSSKLYGYDNESTGFEFTRMLLGPSGLSVIDNNSNLISGFGVDIEYEGGRIYATSGTVIDPDARTVLGTFPATGPLEADSGVGRTFFVSGSGPNVRISAFDQQTFQLVGFVDVGGVSGEPINLVRWGANGLAFSTTGGQVYLVQTFLVAGTPPSPTKTPGSTPTATPSPTSTPRTDRIQQLSLPTNDLVYDRFSQRLYASVPSSAGGTRGNSITPIDPFAGSIGSSVFMGNDPGRLAMSDDGAYLYAGLKAAPAVRRFHIPSQSAGLQFPLGDANFSGEYAEDLEVLPGIPGSVAVSLKNILAFPGHDGVAIYDEGVRRSVKTSGGVFDSNVIEFSDSASRLYGYDNEVSEYGFRRMNVNASGVTVMDNISFLITGYGVDMEYEGGRIYATGGKVIDPEGRTLLGTYAATGPVESDSTVGRTFFVSGSGSNVRLFAFDQQKFTLIGSLDISGVSGTPVTLVRWGPNGLAFNTTGGQVYLVETSLVADTPLPTSTPTPTPTGLHDSAALKISLPNDGGASTPIDVRVQNLGDHSESIGVYVDVGPPGGPSNPYGCAPGGRVLETSVTVSPGQKERVSSVNVSFVCADSAGAHGKPFTIVAVADAHADDVASCGPGQLQSMGCFNALASDDSGPSNNRISRSCCRVGEN
jgi:hypothetical protein